MSPRLRVVGLDLSLTSTGISDGQSVYAIQTKPGPELEDRMDRIVSQCIGLVKSPMQWTDDFPEGRRADLVVLEGAAYGAKGNAVDQLAGLRWLVRWHLWSQDVPFVVVTPSALKNYTTGMGNATKAEMVRAVQARHGLSLAHVTLKAGRSDMADAYALAAMGYARYGQPLPGASQVGPQVDPETADWPGFESLFTRPGFNL